MQDMYLPKIKGIRYIKLGSKQDNYADFCLENGLIVLGYQHIDHFSIKNEENLTEKIKEVYKKQHLDNSKKGATTRHAIQINSFYKSHDILWITFARKKIYWGIVDESIAAFKGKGDCTYKTLKGGWRDHDLSSHKIPLTFDRIAGPLLKVEGFRGTICEIKSRKGEGFDLFEYTQRLIRGEKLADTETALAAHNDLVFHIEKLIKLLHWKDFEHIVDLVFQTSGWRKMTRGGGTESDLDFDLLMPITQERAFVQVKSKTDSQQFKDYYEKFNSSDSYQRMFFVYHSLNGQKINIKDKSDEIEEVNKKTKPFHLIDSRGLASLVVDLGLSSTVIKKVS